jgi:hypothetical protein
VSYSLKVIAHSASKKSILASISKKSGIFTSIIATGNIAIDSSELPAIGTTHMLEGITSVSTKVSTTEDGSKSFDWLVLN